MSRIAPALRLEAPAKINLYLHIVGRRADGYHLLDSLVAFTDLGDELHLGPAERLSLSIEGPFAAGLARDARNLVWRAATALLLAGGFGGKASPGAAIRLVKNLPVAAGIGGGSADAAAAMIGLNRLWGLPVAAKDLPAIGLTLGADLPVCLAGQASFVGGIGEDIMAAPSLPAADLVLVNPRLPLPTERVFKQRAAGPAGDRYSEAARWTDACASAAGLAERLRHRKNDLADAAIGLMPEIAAILAALSAQPGCLLARLSGSGATCFGLFGDSGQAGAAVQAVVGAHPNWWAAATRLRAGAAAV